MFMGSGDKGEDSSEGPFSSLSHPSGYSCGLWSQSASAQALALSLISGLILCDLFYPSLPHFSHL